MVGSTDKFTSKVQCHVPKTSYDWQAWKLIPVKVEGVLAPSQLLSKMLGSGSSPFCDEDATGQSSTRVQRLESERDEFGTIVTEVTVVTTRRRYRLGDI